MKPLSYGMCSSASKAPVLWEHLKWDYKKILVTLVPSIKVSEP
jgi:hypothetical protein